MLFLSIVPAIIKLRKAYQFDAIYAISAYPEGFAAVLLGKLFNVPVVVHAIGTDINVYTKFILRRQLIRWSLNRCNSVISVSYDLKRKMTSIGVDASKIRVIYNGVDREVFNMGKRVDEMSANNIILFVGNLKKEKGIYELIDAYARIASSGVRLVIAGEGPNKDDLIRLIRRKGLINVQVLGGQTPAQVACWMNRAYVVCLPSYSEGLPNVIIEAFACGRPVVATRVGGIPEIVVSEEYGFLVPEKDVDALATKLKEALSREWDREKIRKYSERFSWDEYISYFSGGISQ